MFLLLPDRSIVLKPMDNRKKPASVARNIWLGLTDGITIALVLAAVLTRINLALHVIAIACIALALAGGLTMSAGRYIEGRRYEPEFNLQLSLLVGVGYILGGLLIALVYFVQRDVTSALLLSIIVASLIMLAGGYAESRLFQSNPWTTMLRTWITGLIATGLAYYVAGIF